MSRSLLAGLALLIVFIACCYVIYSYHGWISRFPMLTYGLLGLTAASAILAPALIGRAGFHAFSNAVQRWFSGRSDG